jgi:hypothetical protein
MLEDICICAVHEDLDRRLSKALECSNTAQLYNLVLGRMESDYESEQNRGKALRLFCSLVWASKSGLSLAGELEPILESQGIPEVEWSSFSLVLEELMTNCSGILNFTNADIRLAIEQRYLPHDSDRQEIHRMLHSFFQQSQDITARLAVELPYQLSQGQDWEGLRRCISDMRVFDLLYNNTYKYDLLRYWRQVEQHLACTASDTYYTLLNQGNIPPGIVRSDLTYRYARRNAHMRASSGCRSRCPLIHCTADWTGLGELEWRRSWKRFQVYLVPSESTLWRVTCTKTARSVWKSQRSILLWPRCC